MATTPFPSASAAPAMRRWALIVIALALAAAGGWSGWRAFSPSQPAPIATFTLLDGSRLSTRDLQGKVYLVNFWATDCATCIKEMPGMIRIYDMFKHQGLEFIAVAMRYDPPMYVMNYSRTRQLPFKVAMDAEGSAARAFGNVQLTPTTFLIGKDGRILKRYVGEPDWASFEAMLRRALAQRA